MLLRRVLPIVLVLVLGALGALALMAFGPEAQEEAAPPAPPLVRVLPVQPREIAVRVASQGETAPRTRSQLVAQVGGRIERVAPAFAAGGFFDADQPLVWLDPTDYRLALQQAQADVARAQTLLQQELAQAQVAREEWRELGRGKPSPLVLREPQVAQARAALASARAAVEQARVQLDRTVVRAPYAGRVRGTQADVGQFVAPGTPLADLYATDWAEVRLPIAERDLPFLPIDLGFPQRPGQGTPVELRNGDQRWMGQVVRASGTVDPQTRQLDVYARIKDPFNRSREPGRAALPMGMYVQASIEGRRLQDAYLLPRRALREDDRVAVVEDGRLVFRPVQVLRRRGDEVIVGKGLAPGAQVVVSPLDAPVEGMQVRTVPADEADR